MASKTRVLICGDRDWTNEAFIDEVLSRYVGVEWPIESIIHGNAQGADILAAIWGSKQEDMDVWPFPAYWDCKDYEADTGLTCYMENEHAVEHGKQAGHLRNQRMLDEGNPNFVFAFHNNLKGSKGTKDMVKRSLDAGLHVTLFTEKDSDGTVISAFE